MELTINAAVISIVAGYLLGSIPFGLVLTRIAGLGDLRSIGSGNIGATNVLRTGNKGLAAATLLLDALKGAVAVWFAATHGELAGLIGGLAAFVGHCFPVWLKFRGGKGVATFVGVLAAASWPAALAFAVAWLSVAAISRYSSLAALIATVVSPVAAWFATSWQAAAAFAIMTAIAWIRHRDNISRLAAGTESRIGAKSAGGDTSGEQ